MEFERFKSAWQKQSAEGHALPSRSLQFVRTSAIRDLQRSDMVSRLVFNFLFALLAVGTSVTIMTAAPARIAAWLFAAALLADSIAGLMLLARRSGKPATATMMEFISREHRQIQSHVRLERYSQGVIFVLAALALLILVFARGPANVHEGSLDALQRMAIMTVFLAVAWRRAKSRSREIRSELEHYLNDLRK